MDGSFQIHRTLTTKIFLRPVANLYIYNICMINDYIEDKETKVRQCYDGNM